MLSSYPAILDSGLKSMRREIASGATGFMLKGNSWEGEMADRNETLRLAPFNIIIAAIAISSAALAQAQEVATPEPSITTKPAEVRIVSTEFKYAPANVRVTAGAWSRWLA